MITDQQIRQLSRRYSIDDLTIIREYLQMTVLDYLYRQKGSGRILFKGGTALRLLFRSPRFSEDLDFSTNYGADQIKKIVRAVDRDLTRELPDTKISLIYSGKNGLRFRLRYTPAGLAYPLTIRLDFQFGTLPKGDVTSLATDFPLVVFSPVSHYSEKEILKEKYQALGNRKKGRDFFDIWYLLKKGIRIKPKNKKVMISVIASTPQKQLERDIAKFLPKPHRILLPNLKKYLLELLA